MNVENTKHAAEPYAYRDVEYVWQAPDTQSLKIKLLMAITAAMAK
jgi:altronate hydrolase